MAQDNDIAQAVAEFAGKKKAPGYHHLKIKGEDGRVYQHISSVSCCGKCGGESGGQCEDCLKMVNEIGKLIKDTHESGFNLGKDTIKEGIAIGRECCPSEEAEESGWTFKKVLMNIAWGLVGFAILVVMLMALGGKFNGMFSDNYEPAPTPVYVTDNNQGDNSSPDQGLPQPEPEASSDETAEEIWGEKKTNGKVSDEKLEEAFWATRDYHNNLRLLEVEKIGNIDRDYFLAAIIAQEDGLTKEQRGKKVARITATTSQSFFVNTEDHSSNLSRLTKYAEHCAKGEGLDPKNVDAEWYANSYVTKDNISPSMEETEFSKRVKEDATRLANILKKKGYPPSYFRK